MQPDESSLSAESRLRMALSAAQMGIWQWDVAQNHVYWSPEVEALFGVAAGAFPPTFEAFVDLVHPDDRDGLQSAVNKALTDPAARYDIEHRAVRPDGKNLWVHCTGVVDRDDKGRPTGMVGTVADITSRKGLEKQLHQSQKMEGLGRLAGGVAHDFNNLLTVILGEIELLRRDEKLDANATESLANAHEAARRGQKLTRQLLTFAQQQALHIEAVDANVALQRLEPMLARLAGARVTTEVVVTKKLGSVMVDHTQLEQVMMNLVLNARDAMPDGGTLRIEARPTQPPGSGDRANHGVHITVADTGSGIDELVMSQLFDPFFTTKKTGTGLGLSTCYGIVNRSGGRIWAENRPAGGAIFHFELPTTAEQAILIPALPARMQHASVLIVEDDAVVRSIAARALHEAGFDVMTAENAEQACSLADSRTVDLVVTDVVMPDVDGVTLARKLVDRYHNMKVVYVSGHPEQFERLIGPDKPRFLPKPFTPRGLTSIVCEALGEDEPRPVERN